MNEIESFCLLMVVERFYNRKAYQYLPFTQPHLRVLEYSLDKYDANGGEITIVDVFANCISPRRSEYRSKFHHPISPPNTHFAQ